MNIAIIPQKTNTDLTRRYEPFITELINILANRQEKDFFLLIADNSISYNYSFPENIEVVTLGAKGKSSLLKKYWQELKLPGTLKKLNTDVLISFDGSFSRAAIYPQILSFFGDENPTPGSLRKAKKIIVHTNGDKKELISKYHIAKEKIEIVYPAVSELYKPSDETEREIIKTEYSEGKDYFLCLGRHLKFDTFIQLLQSFSYFKKRQQSSMKLILMTKPDKRSIKRLETYMYRTDVKLIENYSEDEEAAFIRSAYAVIILENEKQSVSFTLKALQSTVAVLADENSVVKEIAGESAIYFDKKLQRDIGEKMIRVYTNESLKNKLTTSGKEIASTYTFEKSARQLWECIGKAVK